MFMLFYRGSWCMSTNLLGIKEDKHHALPLSLSLSLCDSFQQQLGFRSERNQAKMLHALLRTYFAAVKKWKDGTS